MKTMCNCVELDCRRYGCKRTQGPLETQPTGVLPAGTETWPAARENLAGRAPIEAHADVTERFVALFDHHPPAIRAA